MLKDEQNYYYIGGGYAKPLETWSDFSSIEYSSLIPLRTVTSLQRIWLISG